jgi:hypothetical protein
VTFSQPAVFQTRDKAVILSEALRRSIANTGLYGAQSKDPGDAFLQMLLGAFRLRTTTDERRVVFPVGIGLRDPRSQKRDLGHPSVSPIHIADGISFVISLPTRLSKSDPADEKVRGCAFMQSYSR